MHGARTGITGVAFRFEKKPVSDLRGNTSDLQDEAVSKMGSYAAFGSQLLQRQLLNVNAPVAEAGSTICLSRVSVSLVLCFEG